MHVAKGSGLSHNVQLVCPNYFPCDRTISLLKSSSFCFFLPFERFLTWCRRYISPGNTVRLSGLVSTCFAWGSCHLPVFLHKGHLEELGIQTASKAGQIVDTHKL